MSAPLTVSTLLRATDVTRHLKTLLDQETLAQQLLGQSRPQLTADEIEVRRHWREQQHRETLAAIAALAEVTDPLARAVLDLHAPDSYDDCAGCDYSGFEAEAPAYPCRTVRLVAEQQGITMPNNWRPTDVEVSR